MKTKVIAILLLLQVTGCAHKFTELDVEDTIISPTEAVIITKIHSNQAQKVRLHKISSGWPIAIIESSGSSKINANKIDLGSDPTLVRISKISTINHYVFHPKLNDKYSFIVVPGQVNYIGDIEIKVGDIKDRKYSAKNMAFVLPMTTRVYDNEKETIDEAKKIYPAIFEKYPYYSRYAKNVIVAFKMSAAELQSAFSGKTVVGYHNKKEFSFERFYDVDGSMKGVNYIDGERTGQWSVKDGQLCEKWGDKKLMCRDARKVGEEICKYNKYGKLVVTYKKFETGNKLAK